MNESYISKSEGLTTMDLVTHLVFINKEEVTISTLFGLPFDATISRVDMLKIAKFFREDHQHGSSTLKLDNVIFAIYPDWVIIDNGGRIVSMRPEMFAKIVDYIEESEEKTMNESNATQNIYNKIINANSNKPTEEIVKPIEAVEQQPKKVQSIYDTIIDTMKQETKGGNKNGK